MRLVDIQYSQGKIISFSLDTRYLCSTLARSFRLNIYEDLEPMERQRSTLILATSVWRRAGPEKFQVIGWSKSR